MKIFLVGSLIQHNKHNEHNMVVCSESKQEEQKPCKIDKNTFKKKRKENMNTPNICKLFPLLLK